MGTSKSVFWDDLARDLEDPEFLREYVVESVRISTIDQVVNALNDAREAAGLSKAALARAISAEPAAMRRLFSAGQVNPTLGTLAEVAAALGMRITVEPLPVADREQVTTPLLEGRSADMPTLTLHGKDLVYFPAWKHHISLYPIPTGDEAFARELAPYRAARGTVRFPLRKPIPYDLIERLVAFRVKERLDSDERKQ